MTGLSLIGIAAGTLRPIVVTACVGCEQLFSYRRLRCPRCRGLTTVEARLLTGQILTMTTVHRPPSGFESWVPYRVGLIAGGSGIHVLALLAEPCEIDAWVEVGLVDIDEHHDVPVAIVAENNYWVSTDPKSKQ